MRGDEAQDVIMRLVLLQRQNRFITQGRHMQGHMLTNVQAHKHARTFQVINPDGTQLISNSTRLCFQLRFKK